ncbi:MULTISPECIES: DUF2294 domain-containing protein [unclassified Leptolyngbya]|uniref:DUF2294 domain-containing protein n=1 Tax=unclassified Leptolyngbya TaxID=2650499 RepID=UPI001688928D|nr:MULTISPECIES: DUF2294 domain-containing protein [unclassified Leptolyngbya]MBD1910116.1 DUF2294 domain-containing protein [Leptolyngbya sp. FACHB-8]MBD2156888.1 DUF2294 domain-containing protein [Leptolyngbya sp. FACHB-16]
MNDKKYPTVGELQRSLSQSIQALYRTHLEHQPARVTCQLMDTTLVLVLENALTQTETLLQDNGHTELVETVRDHLDTSLKPIVRQEIERILEVGVVDILSDATLETGRSAIVVILDRSPQVRTQRDVTTSKRTPISQG